MDYENVAFNDLDGKRYLVVETVDYNNRKFAYVVNSEDESDSKFVELLSDGIDTIVPELFEGVIYPLFLEKLSDGVLNINN